MAIKVDSGKYQCSYCEKEYAKPEYADHCRESHDLVYIQMSRENLSRLIQFIYTYEVKLLNPQIMKDLKSYASLKLTKEEREDLSSMQTARE